MLKTMNILIIEDEKQNISRLQRILSEISTDFKVVGVLGTVRESIDWFINEPAPDVVLMDIRLADGLSFDIFEKVKVTSPIIFTTSYDEYAVRAFKVNSIDYLLKPIDKEELQIALDKAKAIKNTNLYPDLEQVLQLFKGHNTIYRKRFLISQYDGYKTISVEDIDHIFSENKITYLVTKKGDKDVLMQTLEVLEDELNPDFFFRVNRQFIVNVDSIGFIRNSFNGKMKVILRKYPSKEIVVSREKVILLKKWLNK